LFNLFINDIFNNCNKYGISIINFGNLTNDIVNSNNNNSNNNKSNSYNSNSNNSNSNNSNSNNSNSNNSNSNNSNSNNSNSNISNNIISNVGNSIENNVYVDSSVYGKVFNFLLGGQSINNSTREWKDLFKCQMKSGAYSDTPFLVVTAALLQSIIPIAIGQQWSLFKRFKSNRTTTTKSVNAEETVRQASRASATNEDHWFSKCYLFREFRMKYFKDIEILYEKFYFISKYFPISNSNVNTAIIDMNNIELSSVSDSSTKYIILIILIIEIILLIIVEIVIVKIELLILVIVKIIISLLLI